MTGPNTTPPCNECDGCEDIACAEHGCGRTPPEPAPIGNGMALIPFRDPTDTPEQVRDEVASNARFAAELSKPPEPPRYARIQADPCADCGTHHAGWILCEEAAEFTAALDALRGDQRNGGNDA